MQVLDLHRHRSIKPAGRKFLHGSPVQEISAAFPEHVGTQNTGLKTYSSASAGHLALNDAIAPTKPSVGSPAERFNVPRLTPPTLNELIGHSLPIKCCEIARVVFLR